MTDTELGRTVFSRFNAQMMIQHSKSYQLDEIATAMNFKNKLPVLLDGVGFSYRIGLDLNPSKLETAMRNLVSKSGGKIPSKATLDAALRDVAGSYTFTEAARAVAIGTVKELSDDLQAVGNFTLGLLKWAPYIAAGGLALYFGAKLYLESRKK